MICLNRAMRDRKEKILEAAIQTISRYGVKRTSVSDIASEAGVARQTVYNAFSDKDAILRETVNYLYEKMFNDIKKELQNASTLEQQLDALFEHLAVRKYELTDALPEAEEIISGINEAAKEEIQRGREACRALIEETLRPHDEKIRESGLSVRDLSDFIERSLAHAKTAASDKKHLMKLLTSLKVLVLSLTVRNV